VGQVAEAAGAREVSRKTGGQAVGEKEATLWQD